MAVEREYERFLERIAANLRRVRKQRGLTQEDMAGSGFNYRYYQKLESGTYSFNLHTLFRLSKILKVSMADLLG